MSPKTLPHREHFQGCLPPWDGPLSHSTTPTAVEYIEAIAF